MTAEILFIYSLTISSEQNCWRHASNGINLLTVSSGSRLSKNQNGNHNQTVDIIIVVQSGLYMIFQASLMLLTACL